MENFEYLVVGNGFAETLTTCLLNMWGKRSAQLKAIKNISQKPYSDYSEVIQFDVDGKRCKTQFDPLQEPEFASQIMTDVIFQGQLTSYLTLEKTSEPFIFIEKLQQLPMSKAQLLKSDLSILDKRNIMKFLQSLQNLMMSQCQNYLVSCNSQTGSQVLTPTEQELVKTQPNFSQFLSQFNIQHLSELFTLTLELQSDSDFMTTLKTFAKYFAARNRFDGCGPETVHSYGRSDIIQCFERLIYVYQGVSVYEEGDLDTDAKSFISPGIKLTYGKLITLKYPNTRVKLFQMVFKANDDLKKRFDFETHHNHIVRSKGCAVLLRLGCGDQLSRGLVSADFFKFNTKEECTELADKLGCGEPLNEKMYDNEYVADTCGDVEVPQGDFVLSAFIAAQSVLVNEGIIEFGPISADMDMKTQEEAVDFLFAARVGKAVSAGVDE